MDSGNTRQKQDGPSGNPLRPEEMSESIPNIHDSWIGNLVVLIVGGFVVGLDVLFLLAVAVVARSLEGTIILLGLFAVLLWGWLFAPLPNSPRRFSYSEGGLRLTYRERFLERHLSIQWSDIERIYVVNRRGRSIFLLSLNLKAYLSKSAIANRRWTGVDRLDVSRETFDRVREFLPNGIPYEPVSS